MDVLRGKPISPGYARGKALVYVGSSRLAAPRYAIEPACVSAEQERFHGALDRARQELADLQHRVLIELGQSEADIFRMHLALLEDQAFVSKVHERVREEMVNVEHVLHEELEDLVKLLSDVENEYLRERANDVHDVRSRLMKHLGHGSGDALRSLPPRSVLIAHELLPSDTLSLDRCHVVALVTERGGETSHAAILARSMGIPAVAGVWGACASVRGGADLLIDGVDGTVTVEPAPDQVEAFAAAMDRYSHDADEAEAMTADPCRTSDGVAVELLGNIGRPDEGAQVRRCGLAGVGLFRTEYLFLDAAEPPGLDAQVAAYCKAAAALDGLPLVIRTIDLGGDKKPQFLIPKFELNPMLGLRGLRLSLVEADLLRTQLRAIVRTRQRHANVRLLFPMVLGCDDLCSALEHLEQVCLEEGCEPDLPVGAMVETPSAIFQMEAILQRTDFISLGTNDLVQFMLAADRGAVEMIGAASVLHPSVLRAIDSVVGSAGAAGKPVCVCGEAAADGPVACLLVGLGVRQLSMSPICAARVRRTVRCHALADLEDLARRALDCESERDVLSLVRRHLGPVSSHPAGTRAV